MKARIKQFLAAHPSLQFLLPACQFMLGLPFKIRNAFFREILRWRLFRLWLTQRKPLVLFARFGGIGDILCSLPAYEALCRANPSTQGVFITLTEFKCLPILAHAPGLVCPSRSHCSVPKFPAWLVARVFSPQYADELGQPNTNPHLIADFFTTCGLAPTAARPRFQVQPDLRKHICAALGIKSEASAKIVVIHPGPTWKVKEWPMAYWQSLVNGLRKSASVRIFQIGAHRHVTLGAIEAVALQGVESLVEKLSLEDIAALLTVTNLFIGIDSGMIHMAGAADTSSIGIFGPTDPARILRYPGAVGLSHPLPCSFCHHRQPRLHYQSGCPHDIACMTRLRPETVLERSLELLAAEKI